MVSPRSIPTGAIKATGVFQRSRMGHSSNIKRGERIIFKKGRRPVLDAVHSQYRIAKNQP
jgi:hypothetical protein